MKKFLLILLAFFFGLTVQSQSKTFLGLTLGKAYTEQQVRSTIESNTKGYKISRNHINDYIVLPVQTGVIDDRKPYYLFSLTDNNVFKDIMITYNQGYGNLDSLYAHLADSLSTKYKMYSDSTIFSKSCICLDADGMTIDLTKYDTDITLSYSDNNYKEVESKSLMDFIPKPPEIQDTFFGLKLGQKYTIPRIKVLIETKGHGGYFNSERSAIGMRVQFFDVSFAGKIWDFCEIFLTENDEFAQFTIYKSLDNYNEEEREAKEVYESYKKTLDKKYGTDMLPIVNDEGEDISANYYGVNKISLSLYNRKDKSSGGSYRRYVGMQYSHYEIMKTTLEAFENEL